MQNVVIFIASKGSNFCGVFFPMQYSAWSDMKQQTYIQNTDQLTVSFPRVLVRLASQAAARSSLYSKHNMLA